MNTIGIWHQITYMSWKQSLFQLLNRLCCKETNASLRKNLKQKFKLGSLIDAVGIM